MYRVLLELCSSLVCKLQTQQPGETQQQNPTPLAPDNSASIGWLPLTGQGQAYTPGQQLSDTWTTPLTQTSWGKEYASWHKLQEHTGINFESASQIAEMPSKAEFLVCSGVFSQWCL